MTLDGRLLSNVSVLAAVVEGGNFARAADALGLTPSGVSRAIARLEARIGVRLLDRTTRSVSLTDEGRSLYANINPLVLGIEDAVTHTSGSSGSVRGRLRVNADAFTSRLLLSPHIGRFLDLYPEVSLELSAREQLGDLLEQALLGRGPGIEQDVGLLQQWANTIHGLGILHDTPPGGERI